MTIHFSGAASLKVSGECRECWGDGQLESGAGRNQSWSELFGHISRDTMSVSGKLGWQRRWYRGISEEGIQRKENSVRLKPGHEGERLSSLAPSPDSHLSLLHQLLALGHQEPMEFTPID